MELTSAKFAPCFCVYFDSVHFDLRDSEQPRTVPRTVCSPLFTVLETLALAQSPHTTVALYHSLGWSGRQ